MLYFYVKQSPSQKRGWDELIEVFTIRKDDGYFDLVGSGDFQLGAWRGSTSEASQIIHKERGHKLTKDGYRLLSKKIALRFLP